MLLCNNIGFILLIIYDLYHFIILIHGNDDVDGSDDDFHAMFQLSTSLGLIGDWVKLHRWMYDDEDDDDDW